MPDLAELSQPPPPGPPVARQALLVGIAVMLLVLGVGYVLKGCGSDSDPIALPVVKPPIPQGKREALPDPLRFEAAREAEYVQRASAGESHALYALSPGGVIATAARVERFRADIESAAKKGGVDPDTLEAIVFLESAGRPAAIAGDGNLANAAGLTQILAETAQSLLGMKVDLAQSRKLTRQAERALQRDDDLRRAKRLFARRAKIDERFDPKKALAATVRYLGIAGDKFGRGDLAIASYHMGIGNLQAVLADFGGGTPSYARLYFSSTPVHNPKTWARLSDLGDDSATYLWRVLAAKQIMDGYRENRSGLRRIADLQTRKGSAEEVLHPRDGTEVFKEPKDIRGALLEQRLVPLPRSPRLLGMRLDRQIGEVAGKVGATRSLYRAARPEAIATMRWIATAVRELSGTAAPLILTSAVRDERYQRLLTQTNSEATSGFSLHTSGFAFDILRRYANKRQAVAFQFVLDRLQAMDLVAWVREPAAIHITAATDAGGLTTG